MLLVYEFMEYRQKCKMKTTILDTHTHLKKLSLSDSAYCNSKISNDEIKINGKMYDVKYVYFTGDSVQLLLISDTKEDSILAELEGFVNSTNNNNSPLQQRILKLLFLDYTFPIHSTDYLNISKHYTISNVTYFIRNLNLIPSFLSEIQPPPPRFV